jgi:hypothetical protein
MEREQGRREGLPLGEKKWFAKSIYNAAVIRLANQDGRISRLSVVEYIRDLKESKLASWMSLQSLAAGLRGAEIQEEAQRIGGSAANKKNIKLAQRALVERYEQSGIVEEEYALLHELLFND